MYSDDVQGEGGKVGETEVLDREWGKKRLLIKPIYVHSFIGSCMFHSLIGRCE